MKDFEAFHCPPVHLADRKIALCRLQGGVG
jgi:hypothetical protein